MCYAIPGKIIGINDKIVTVEYFGEQRKARNEFFQLTLGEYVYAQGGFVIQKISQREALPILETWKDLFFKLQEVDQELARNPQNLYQKANNLRQKYHGNSCCVHGIIEFSNYCVSDCLYCGIRKSNDLIKRYRMSIEEIIEAASLAVNKFKFKALVLQSAEDLWYDQDKLVSIIKRIRKEAPCLIALSLGERELSVYQRLYKEGARGILLRFETSNEGIYEKLRPGHKLNDRLELIKKLKEIGYLVMTGFLIGLPGQTDEDLGRDIKLTDSMGPEMFSFGPFIPHPQTTLAKTALVSVEYVLNIIAKARIQSPKARILVNTSFETLDRNNAIRLGLMAGANSLMINLTPRKYQKLYDIYPSRAGLDTSIEERIEYVIKILHSIGRAPTDLGV
ncbi:MAG: radical SAM protein [Candidatus Omnitrophota bacterium]